MTTLRSRHWMLLGLVACVPQEDTASTAGMTFDEFVAQAYREPDTGMYIVDGDTPAGDLTALRAIYDRMLEGQQLAVFNNGTADAVWNADQRRRLAYCVSTAFGARHAQVLAALEAAARDWEQSIDVDFVHDPGQDGACTALNANVIFDVRPTNNAPYLARAFFPSQGRGERNILVDDTAFTNASFDLVQIMRHELGHALGFRHEHTRPEAGTCFEDTAYRPLTPYDSASVMHYPQCHGTAVRLQLTALDRAGAISIYGPPARGYAFQANSGELWTHAGRAGYGMMAKTSPAFAGGFLAFQANTGELWIGTDRTGLGMMPGTSPSITNRGEVAFQANTGELWVGNTPTGLGMMPGTSPDIVALPGGGTMWAFQANTGELWIGRARTGFGMAPKTSPSIAAAPSGGYLVAFQANTGELWVGGGRTGLGMMAGTSPSIAAIGPAAYRVAFQANNGELWIDYTPTGLGMAPGTSPTVAPNGDVLFQANTGTMWRFDGGAAPLGLGLAPATSPAN